METTNNFNNFNFMTLDTFNKTLEGMIISPSGWRGIFAGNEESKTPAISAEFAFIAFLAARVFAAYLKQARQTSRPCIITGMDTRPTGPAIAQAIIAALKKEGCDVRHCGIIAAPEIMAYARDLGKTSPCAFIYISASHNPIGHNGIKFGLCDGGVLPPNEASTLITEFRKVCHEQTEDSLRTADCAGSIQYEVQNIENQKACALSAYAAFTTEVITGETDATEQKAVMAKLREAFAKRQLGIAADFNGSARAASIDGQYLRDLGLCFCAINDKPGDIAHRIVPEGESLEPCRAMLAELHSKNSAFLLGYTPDCDGDRGNLVIWDERRKDARALEAQEVFALAVLAELRFLKERGADMSKVAVAVNDPTSMRVDELAAGFGARVFRAEVGEANVVALARKLRADDWTVRPLGEGAAGGVIIYPSSVRDPLNTLGAIIKMLAAGKGGYSAILADAFNAIPRWTTTGAYSPQAVLKVKTEDHSILKERYQSVFLREWEAKKAALKKRRGIISWRAFRYNGTDEQEATHFGEAGRGGLKIIFYNEAGADSAIWMRGSGTEPVFRIMADIKGSDAGYEAELLKWQHDMTSLADAGF
ncbi:MAG: phosphatidylglycerol lysyltransferase [Spirochaetaceae bacterium]|jgi:phosphoglucomutase|nr:phosphatidylglycerol lysyltransferase [Spirochaetaceae bacterium]